MPRYGGDKERGTQTNRRRAQNAPAKSCAPNSPQAAGSIPPKLSDQFPPTVRFDLDTCGSMWHVFCLITVSSPFLLSTGAWEAGTHEKKGAKIVHQLMPRASNGALGRKDTIIADLRKMAVAEWLQSFNSVRGPMERLAII